MVKKQSFIFAILIVLAVCLIQFFFVSTYWNDKTSTVARIIANMMANKSIVAQNFACNNLNGSAGSYVLWGEEPPVFHVISIGFKYLFGEWSFRIIPLLSYMLNVFGLAFLINELSGYKDKINIFLVAALCFTPSLYIHAMRFLPDNLAMTFLIWGMLFFLRDKRILSFIFITLAVTTKILPIVPVFFFCLFHLYFYKKDFKKNFAFYTALGLSILPSIVWLYYLKFNKIPNPFFEIGSSGVPQHIGGSHFEILAKYKYWSKIFQWYFYRGIGVVWLFSFIAIIAKDKFANLSTNQKITALTAGSFILNVVLLRGPQITAPWYSFYYQIFFITLAGVYYLKLEPKWQKVLIVVSLLQSITFLEYELSPNFESYSSAPVDIHCDFHKTKAILDQKNKLN